jgi:hypothetical protein
MPVGGVGSDTFDDFASQLSPYLDKVIRYYNGQLTGNGRFYFVTPHIGEEPTKFWDAFGKTKIDLWGRPGPNGEKDAACWVNGTSVCYRRWPAETYPDATTFINAVLAGEDGMGDFSIDDPQVLISHMNSAVNDVVEIDAHANELDEIASSAEVKAMTKAGLFVALDGCGVAAYTMPRSPSLTNAAASVDGNVMLSYLYGASQAIAVSGDPFWRGHYAKHPTMYLHLKTVAGSYLGRAHLERNKEQFQRAASATELREFGMEMLAGDPFMNLSP